MKVIGYCHGCKSLSEYEDRPIPSPLVRPTCYLQRPVPIEPGSRALSSTVFCGKPIVDLWANHATAKAIIAAYALGGLPAAVAVWEEAGRPALAYEW